MGAYIYDPVEKKLVPLVSNDDHLTDEMIAGYEASNLATNAYSVGEQLIYNGKLYTVTSPIAIGDDITNKIAESESLSKQLLGYEKKIWKGTEEEWEALSAAEKANYTTAIITNDTINSPIEFQGATENSNGIKGLVPKPLAGDQKKVLYGDGTWGDISGDVSGLLDLIAPTEISPSESAYEVNNYLIFDDKLYKVTSAISIGDSLIEGTNIEKTTMMEEIKNGIEPIEPVKTVHVYGAEWRGTSAPQWTRTDDSALFLDPVPAVNNGTGSSPFDNCAPWKDIKRQTSATSGEVVYIPKFWVKITTPSGGSGLKIQIADGETEGFVPAPAFQDRGDGRGELDYILVGRYHCASDFKSETGITPHANITRDAFRTGIHNLGTDVYQWDYAVRLTLSYLYLVEFADWNSQATIGYGCGNNSSTQNMGATDSMQYHTGTAAANRTTYGVGVQYRYIEGLWDNVDDWVDGIYFSGTSVYIIKNPNNFSDSSNGTKIGTRPTTGNCISAFFFGLKNCATFIYPSAVVDYSSGEYYVCDNCTYSKTSCVLYAGGSYNRSVLSGLFSLSDYDNSAGANYKHAHIGSRLMELPSIPQ